MPEPVLVDQALARKLERAEGCANAAFVEARACRFPESGAGWIEVAGAYAMFDGPSSLITQTFGLGMFQAPTAADMDALESFFRERGAPVQHEVSPLADKSVLPLLAGRGYEPVELTTILFLPLAGVQFQPERGAVVVRLAKEDEQELWGQTASAGWSDSTEVAAHVEDLMRIAPEAAGARLFLAEREGRAIAAGALNIHGSVALLAGASTVPQYRRLGAQRALLAGRLRYAAGMGCELAMMGAEPGGASQRNAERAGFRIAYTRIKWRQRESP